jgi:phage gp45-like
MNDLFDTMRRTLLSVVRATFVSADDSKKMQELTVRTRWGETQKEVEYWQPHGFSHVPLPPDKEHQAEVLLAYLGGAAEHPVAIAVADRRHRPTNLKEGDVAMFDHRKQIVTFHKDGVTKQSPLTITHQVVDDKGKVLSTIVQHKGEKKITMTTADGAQIVMDGASIKKKVGQGGSFEFDGPVKIKGSLHASETITAPFVGQG